MKLDLNNELKDEEIISDIVEKGELCSHKFISIMTKSEVNIC